MTLTLTRTLLAGLAAVTLALPAFAAAPQPRRNMEANAYSGRWFEIARTPNAQQRNCQAPTSDWSRAANGQLSVTQTCRRGSPTGRATTTRVGARITDTRTNAKVTLSFLGGIRKQEYWMIDRADDSGWAIMGTPGGNYVWVLSRSSTLAPAVRAQVLSRLTALGYDPARLEFPQHAR